MVQKILRTMQDDLRAIKETKERRQQGKGNLSKEEQKKEESPIQINDNLQQPIANREKPQTLGMGQKAPVLTSSDSDGKNNRDEEVARIREEMEKMPANAIAPVSANQEEERLEKEKKDLEEQRRKIEEMQKKAEEEAKLEAERIAKEEAKKQKIEEERIQAEEKARIEAERKVREEAERQKIKEEKERLEEEKARLQAEEDARKKRQEEEESEITETNETKKGNIEEEVKDAEEKKQRIERERERIEELKKRQKELDELREMQERIKMEEEIEKKIEEERKAREKEEIHRMEELREKEDEIKKAEEEAKRQEEELAKQEEEEIRKTEEEAKRMEEEAEKIKEELAKKEEYLQRMEKEEKERIEELIKNEEDMREAEKELERKEKELEQKEKERGKREELRKKMRAEILEEELPEEEERKEKNTINKPELIEDEIAKEEELYSMIPDKDSTIQDDKNSEKSEKYPASSPYKAEKEMQVALGEEAYREVPLVDSSSKSGAYTDNIRGNKGDEELSSLIKRVSNAMNATVKQEGNAVSTEAQNPDKDSNIKELIARMSKDLEKEKEMLEKGWHENKTSPQPDLAETEIKPASALEPEVKLAPEPKSEPLPIVPDIQPEESPAEPVTLSQPPIAQTAATERTDPPQIEKPADNPGSYWAKLHDTLKNSAEKPNTQTYTNANLEETGLIVPKKTAQEQKQTEEFLLPKKTRPKKPFGDDYADPENRLIFGKQEFYSSMHKKVQPKTWEANLEELKETVKEEEVKLSDEEEKKKLRHQIITKYKIELFSMPWAKIVIFSFLFLATLGITLYVLIPKFIPKEQVTEEIITGESIAEIDKLVPQKIVAKQKEVSALNYFDSEIDPWKSLADGSITRIVINNNEHEVMLPRDEALKIILGESNFNNAPQNILGSLDNEYDILAFKNNDVLRLGIVLKYNRNQEENFRQTMASWAETPAKAQKIHNIMKALFVNSKIEEKSSTAFQPSSYSNVNIYYLNLPDTDTSMDYFMYKGYLVFTTSKNTTSEMIDLLQQ